MTPDVRIIPRVSAEGHPFSEILYTWQEGGAERHACTRLWYAIGDTPHARTNEAQQFMKRRGRL